LLLVFIQCNCRCINFRSHLFGYIRFRVKVKITSSTDCNTSVNRTFIRRLLDSFEPVDTTTVQCLISNVASKTCKPDPAPNRYGWLSGLLASYRCSLQHCSMRLFVTTCFHRHKKFAVVTPLLKKRTLDRSNTANYRPISNLTFMSKLLECCTHYQLNALLQCHGLIQEHQSAYRRCHSTETAMLKVLSGSYAADDTGCVILLSFLDLSAPFNMLIVRC